MVPRSPVSRKRGSVAVSTTGSRMITSPTAWPTLSFDQATAITRAVPAKSGMSNDDLGGAVGLDGDDAGIERERLLRRRAALQLGGRAVAAGADLAARALHAVDQLAVEVADFGGEPALAEIIVVRRRRLVVGEVENADIDRGDHDARLLAGGRARRSCTGMRSALFGRIELRQLQVDRERARLAVDREPLHADGAAGHALGRGVERTAQRRDHIGAAAPVVADRNAQRARCPAGTSCVTVVISRSPITLSVTLPAVRAVTATVMVSPGTYSRLVERDLEHVGRVGARVGVPAGVEADRGHRAVAIAGRDFEPIAAPLHRQRDARRLVGGDVERAVGDALGRS